MRGLERFAPLSGLLFVLLVIIAVIVGGETPGADDGIVKVINYWQNNDDQAIAASIIAAFSAVALLWFAGVWRAALAAAEGGPARLANTAFAGADHGRRGMVDADRVQLHGCRDGRRRRAPGNPDVLCPAVGLLLPAGNRVRGLPLASGLAMLRTRLFPAWMGWAAVVLGVLSVTPAGFFAILLMLAGIIAVSLMLFMRGTPATPATGRGRCRLPIDVSRSRARP